VSKQHFSLLAFTILLAPLSGMSQAFGDEIQWRESYSSAKQDALDTGKPMLMEFGSPACFWCQRLEANTLSTSDVAKIVNDKFIPVKIDATAETELASAVAVHSFPTLFVVAPDRTILNRHEGFMEVSDAIDFLQEGLAKAPDPAKIARKSKAIAANAKTQSPFKTTSRQTETDVKAAELSAEQRARAQRLLTHAREDLDDGSILASLDHCRILLKDFAGQKEADEARKLMDQITSNPDGLRRAGNDLGANLAEIYRKLADDAAKNGRDSDAKTFGKLAAQAVAFQSK
jgi:thioredoxin-related protein